MSCVLSCTNPTVRIKACGGLSPYTWTKTGNCTLSAQQGTAITVSTTAVGIPGVFPGQTATITNMSMDLTEYIADNGPCAGGHFTGIRTTGSTLATLLDCDGNLITASGGIVGTGTIVFHFAPKCTGCGDTEPATGNSGNPIFSTICGPRDGGQITFNLELPAANALGGTFSAVASSGPLAFPGVYLSFGPSGPYDNRTDAMIAGGCGCNQGPTTVTVTDSLGVQSTVILGV